MEWTQLQLALWVTALHDSPGLHTSDISRYVFKSCGLFRRVRIHVPVRCWFILNSQLSGCGTREWCCLCSKIHCYCKFAVIYNNNSSLKEIIPVRNYANCRSPKKCDTTGLSSCLNYNVEYMQSKETLHVIYRKNSCISCTPNFQAWLQKNNETWNEILQVQQMRRIRNDCLVTMPSFKERKLDTSHVWQTTKKFDFYISCVWIQCL